jgi:ankyrin repeat protein
MFVHRSPAETIVGAVEDNNVTALSNALETMPRDRYAAATFSIPQPQSSVHSPQVKPTLPDTNISLLHIAAYFDSLDCFLYLEDKGLSYDQESAASYLPIHYACSNGSYEVVCYIIKKDPRQAGILPAVEWHLPYLATIAGDPEILGLLLQNGADLSLPQNIDNQPVSQAIRRRNVECLRLLLKYKLRTARDISDHSTLMHAIANNEMEAIPLLLDSGEDPAFISARTHESALFLACFQGEQWLPVVKLICERTTKLDLDPLIIEKAAIHWACSSKCPEIVRVVLEKGIDVNRVDSKGKSGLFYLVDACEEETMVQIMEIMVQYGFKLHEHPSVLADYAMAMRKPFTAIEWLFEHGVDPTVKWQNKRLMDYLNVRGNRRMQKIYDKYCKGKK